MPEDQVNASEPTFLEALEAFEDASKPISNKSHRNIDSSYGGSNASGIVCSNVIGTASFDVNESKRTVTITVSGLQNESPNTRISGDTSCIQSCKFKTTKTGSDDEPEYTCVATVVYKTSVNNARYTVFLYIDSYAGKISFVKAAPTNLYIAELVDQNGESVLDLVSGESAVLSILENFDSEFPESADKVYIDVSKGASALSINGLSVTARNIRQTTNCTITILIRKPSIKNVTTLTPYTPGPVVPDTRPISDSVYYPSSSPYPVVYSHRLDLQITVYPDDLQLKTVKIKNIYGMGAVIPSKRRMPVTEDYAVGFSVYFSGTGRIAAHAIDDAASDPTIDALYDESGVLHLPPKNSGVTEYSIKTPSVVTLGDTMDLISGYSPETVEDVFGRSVVLFGKSADMPVDIQLSIPSSMLSSVNSTGKNVKAFRMDSFFDTHQRELYPAIYASVAGDGMFWFGDLDLNGGSAPSGQRYAGVLKNLNVENSELISVNASGCNIRACTIVEKRDDYDTSRGAHFVNCGIQSCVFDGSDGVELVGRCAASACDITSSEFKHMYAETLLEGCLVSQCYFHDSKAGNLNFGGYMTGCIIDDMVGSDVLAQNTKESDLYVKYMYLGELSSFLPENSDDNAVLKSGTDVDTFFSSSCDPDVYDAVVVWRPKGSEHMAIGYMYSVDTESGAKHKEFLDIPPGILFYINRDYFGKYTYEKLADVPEERYLEIVNDISQRVFTTVGPILGITNKWEAVRDYFTSWDSLSKKAREIRAEQEAVRKAQMAAAVTAAYEAQMARDAAITAAWEKAQDEKYEKWIFVAGRGRVHCKTHAKCAELEEQAAQAAVAYKEQKKREEEARKAEEQAFRAWFATERQWPGSLWSYCNDASRSSACVETARAAWSFVRQDPSRYTFGVETHYNWEGGPKDSRLNKNYTVTQTFVAIDKSRGPCVSSKGECTSIFGTFQTSSSGSCENSSQYSWYNEHGYECTCTCTERRGVVDLGIPGITYYRKWR